MKKTQRLVGPNLLDGSPNGIPRIALRRLLGRRQLGIGSRVLDVGCGTGELVDLLSDLGLEAVGIDESVEAVEAAQYNVPRAEFYSIDAAGPVFFAEDPFDLILIRRCPLDEGSLLSSSALMMIDQWLSMLRPGGCLVRWLPAQQGFRDCRHRHWAECFLNQFRQFAGTCTIERFQDPSATMLLWNRIWRRGSQPDSQMIVLQTSFGPRPQTTWSHVGMKFSRLDADGCCPLCTSLESNVGLSSRAA